MVCVCNGQVLVFRNILYCLCTVWFLFFQLKSVYEIAIELNRIHSLGLRGELAPADITGGTFSLSNIGFVCHMSPDQDSPV